MPCEPPALKKQALATAPGADPGRKRAGTDPGPGRRPGSGAARAPTDRAALPRAAGFWLVAGVLFLLLFASAAASPLYSVYQAQWRFSATTLTAVFAVYVLVLLLTLLVFGSLSDYLGRRRVIAVALAASPAAAAARRWSPAPPSSWAWAPAGWAPARWSSTRPRPPIWSGGCSSAPR